MAAPRTRPFIGINADLVTPAKAAPMTRLPVGYADAITQSGGLPVILPPYAKDVELDALLDRLDGIVFTGGLDLDPRRAGQPTHPAVVPMPERREVNDRRLIQAVIDRRMPILAIGVGMQLLNVTLGGSLFLHLPEENPKALPHFDPSGYPHRHTVMLETEHPARRDLRRRRTPGQQRPPPGGQDAGPEAEGRRVGPGRHHRSRRIGRPGMVLRRRAVAPGGGHGVGARHATLRVLRAGVPAGEPAAGDGGVIWW